MKSPRQRTPRFRTTARPRSERGSFLRFLLILAVVAWTIRSLIVAPFSIPSGSMLPTLYIGDYLFVAKWPYGYSRYSFPFQIPPIEGRIFGHLPSRGAVVVFRHPREGTDLIKRVIALPGERVEVRNGALILNGKPLKRDRPHRYSLPMSPNTPCKAPPPARPEVAAVADRPYCLLLSYRETLPGGPSYSVIDQVDGGIADDFGPETVPDGHVFLMGDNRDDSLDSRFPVSAGGIGMVPVENLIGRALVTFWSTDGSASYINPLSWFSALRLERLGNGFSGQAE
ncbi:MAG: signal peptidase I [Sphingomicrobium sp.]